MKKFVLIFICLFSFSSFAGDYIVYPQTGKETLVASYLRSKYSISPESVFTSKELQKISLSQVLLTAMKVRIPDLMKVNLQEDIFLKKNTKKIEKNTKLKFFQFKKGEFENFQWGLKNLGESIDLKLTDIDRLKLPSKQGEDINLGSLREIESNKVRVAVIDSGLDLSHPEFKFNVYRNEQECEAWKQYQSCLEGNTENPDLTQSCHDKWAKTDTDQNGYPMDCQGWNVAAPVNPYTNIQGNNDVLDLVGHGTHISGIIAAAQDEIGTSGIISNVEILPVKVSGSTEEVQEDNTTDIFAKGILYALKQNVDIINLSVGWSSNEDSLIVSELVKKAHEMGVLVVVAGGNSAHSTETFPCAYNEVICVGSHNPDGSRSHFSNFGSSVDVFAPGHNILSTWPIEIRPKLFTVRHGYEFKNGTSFSAPFAVGVLARLLNLGFSPDVARVKLLGGARKSELNPIVVNGNVDFQKAVSFSAKSFIYPFKKSSAFINWHEGEKKFVLKLKNYVKDAKGVVLKLSTRNKSIKVKEETKQFTTWKQDEIKDVVFILEGDEFVQSEMIFDLIITSNEENKSYPVQAVATTVVHDKFIRDDFKKIKVQTNRDLEEFDFLPFENLGLSRDTDFLISQIVESKLVIGVLKFFENSYKISKLHTTVFDKARIIQAGKIDIDLDGKDDYVLTGMYQNKDKKWTAKFYVFDENFRPSEIKICPDNEHVNLLTSMGTDLRWIKMNNRMVPTWIASGYSPAIDLPIYNPLTARASNDFKKRIYYLDDKGLRVLTMPSVNWTDFNPMEFFNQTKEDLVDGKIKFLYTLDTGFKKTYSLSDTKNLDIQESFVLGNYQNLYSIDGMIYKNTDDIIFSESDAITSVSRLTVLNPTLQGSIQQEFVYSDLLDPIQLILDRTSNGHFFSLTKYNLLYLKGDTVFKTENRNVSNQIQYKRLKSLEGLYLSSEDTPGFSSELVQFLDGKLIRPAKYRFLMGSGCQEIGHHFSKWEDQDQIYFYCDNSKSILKMNL